MTSDSDRLAAKEHKRDGNTGKEAESSVHFDEPRLPSSQSAPPAGQRNSEAPRPEFYLPKSDDAWPKKPEEYPFWHEGLCKLHPIETHVNDTIKAAEKLIGDPDGYHDHFTNLHTAAASLAQMMKKVFGRGGVKPKDGLFGSVQEGRKAKELLPILALYHDIGKAIAHPGHPALGYRILHDMAPRERAKLETIFRNSKVNLTPESFYRIIRYHDIFGVICTGEASLPMLVDIYSAVADKSNRHESRKVLGLLVLLNLADIHATPTLKGGLPEERAEMILSDWREIDGILNDGEIHSRADFSNALQRKVSQQEAATARVARLFVAAVMRAGKGKVLVRLHEKRIEELMSTFFGNRFDTFASRFSRFCKFDYGLAFFSDIIRYSSLPVGSSEPTDDFSYTSEQLRPAIIPMLKVLNRIVEDYSGLVDESGDTGRRLIVNMGVLDRGSDEEGERGGVRRKIASLLAGEDRDVEALSWLADEIGVSVIS